MLLPVFMLDGYCKDSDAISILYILAASILFSS
jgi:hypothetical protein